MENAPLYILPLWVVGLIFISILTIALEAGFRVGLIRRAHWKDADSGGGALVLTSMFAVMGLVLAFTYGSGQTRFDARKNAVMIEANALGTAFHRADLVAEPGRTELRTILLDYARTRAFEPGTVKTYEQFRAVVKITLNKMELIWPATKRMIEQGKPGPVEASVVAAINNVLDAHTIRMTAVRDHLPRIIMWMLVFVVAAALAVAGYNAGIQGRMSRWRMSAFVLVLTTLMLIILDFDRPNDGLVIVSNKSIYTVIEQMEAELGR
jgi:membrane protease YdiL (CAAX protease family)